MNLRVGIPIKQGFQEFVDTNINDPQSSSGFCIDIFLNAIQLIPITINYTFVPFMNQIGKSNGSYDELLQQIVDQKVDAVVGDITIVANRSQLVDFPLPYLQSEVTLLISKQNDNDGDIWHKSCKRSNFDIKEIKKNGNSVGFLNGSFVEDYLKKLGFSETQLKSYGSPEEYKEALEKGTSNGGVAAIFDELPYIKVFLGKYPSGRFQTIGPVYKNDGFGFAFPKGSPLVAYFSRAILNVNEDVYKMSKIEKEYFSNPDAPPIPNFSDSSLDVRRFGGLFIIMALVNMLALLIYMVQFSLTYWPELTQSSFTFKMVEMVRLFYNLHFRSSSLQTTHSRVYSVPSTPHNLGIVNEDQNGT
ncbi:hypothetical protein Csa_020069 [Cucumis sativus]|nr:hypothetical protein Csa_020069 [Cucumis sativus]